MRDPHEEIEQRSVIGRAIDRADAARRGAVREFVVPGRRFGVLPRGLLGVLTGMSVGGVISLCLAAILLEHDSWAWMAPLLPAVFVSGGALLALEYSGGSIVLVGVDGAHVGERFIPYPEISGVHRDGQRISLILIGGEQVKLVEAAAAGASDLLLTELVDAIEEARAAWASRQHVDERDAVTRGERTGSQWLQALRRLGARSSAVYRAAGIDGARLSQLLDDSRARPSARAAAAVVLVAAGDLSSASRLRVAAESLADPRLRAAFDSVADASDDAAVAEALEALDEVDRRERL